MHLKDTRHNREDAKLLTNRLASCGEDTSNKTDPDVNGWTRATGHNANWCLLVNNVSTADNE